MNFKTLAVLSLVAFWSCNQEKDQVQEAEKEVLTIHDEVMPRMDDVMKLKQGLTVKIASLDSMQEDGVSSTTLAEERLKATDLNRQLVLADSLMMEWMYQYRGDSAKALPADQALEYFNKEKEKITVVREKTLKSIQEAEGFLKK
ncbi:viral A-type inclusion protein [Telluribacter sp. SYSU D00476]|uniref:viral A-type inclusion protein n=1 Tax=Telluribacter sp. SYSU D00476 TaxID=2811430 RepID=UPI001FF26C99|nr:viral A-type inclusion protein [Telluribacter sp. SYSU D00476]